MRRTILVTGASGFVGRHLCRKLAQSGHDVRVVIRKPDDVLAQLGAQLWIGDLWDAGIVKQALHGVDAVIHCAGDASFGNGPHYQRANVELTQHLLSCAAASAKPGARFVFVSTIGAIDRPAGDACDAPLDECSIPAPTSDYGRSKLAAEALVKASGMSFTIVRPAMVVGADMRFASHFAVFARKAMSNSILGSVAWPGSFSVVHVDDLASALELAATHPDSAGRTFFCAGESISLRDYFQLCAPSRRRVPLAALTRAARPIVRWAPFPVKALLLPALTASDAALRSLGWQPRHTVAQALADVTARERTRTNADLDPGGQTVITGAASGLGRALTELIAPKRSAVLLVDKDRAGLDAIAAKHPHCRTIAVDLSDEEQVRTLLLGEQWQARPVRELLACAGIGARGAVQELSLKTQQAMFNVNVGSRLVLAHTAARDMARDQFGRIVFISSSSAFQPLPFMAVYAASNAALLHLGEAWASELAGQGVRLLTVCPGGMQTNFQTSAGVKTLEGEKLMPPTEVASRVFDGLIGKRTTLIVSTRSLAMSLLARLLPRAISLALWSRLMGRMR